MLYVSSLCGHFLLAQILPDGWRRMWPSLSRWGVVSHNSSGEVNEQSSRPTRKPSHCYWALWFQLSISPKGQFTFKMSAAKISPLLAGKLTSHNFNLLSWHFYTKHLTRSEFNHEDTNYKQESSEDSRWRRPEAIERKHCRILVKTFPWSTWNSTPDILSDSWLMRLACIFAWPMIRS